MRRVADGNCLFFRDDSTAALADSYCDEIEIVHSAGVPGTDAHSISAMVALLLHFVAAENGLDCDLRIAADFTGPVNEPFTIPLDILLVLWRMCSWIVLYWLNHPHSLGWEQIRFPP